MRILKFICFLFIVFSNTSVAQNRANIWMLGYAYDPNLDRIGINFNSGSADTFSLQRQMEFFLTNASICDTSGQLLFYTNGQWIGNRNHDTLFNSQNFNSGWATDSFYLAGLGFEQGAIFFPEPGSNSRYYVFYITGEALFPYYLSGDPNQYFDGQPFHLSYSVIDMTHDGGLGGIDPLYKNIHAIDDTLLLGRLTVCKLEMDETGG